MFPFTILAFTALSSAIAISPVLNNEVTNTTTSSSVATNRYPVASFSVAAAGSTSVRSSARPTKSASSSGYSKYPPACTSQLATQKVEITKPVGHNGIRLDNVPAPCMDVALSIMKNDTQIDGPAPQSIDADSILFDFLSKAEYEFLSDLFDGWAASQAGLMKRHLDSEGNM